MKNKGIKIITVLVVLNIVVFGIFGVLRHQNNIAASADTNIYVSEKTTGDIVSINCQNEDMPFEFNLKDSSWVLASDETFPVSTETVNEFLEKGNNLIAARLVSSDGDYERFGLNSPQQTITLTDSQGVSVTYLIGSYNENIERYYACEKDSQNIYIINKSVGDVLVQDLYSYAASYDLSGLSKATLLSFDCVTPESQVSVFQTEKDQNSPMGSSSIWRFSQPFNSDTFVDANKVDSFIAKLKTAAESKCVSYSPDEADIENYGLSNPQSSFKLTYTTDSGEKQAVMYLGKENEDGSIYIMFEGASTIGLLDSETASSLKEYFDCYKFVPQSICAVKKDKVDTMTVTANGTTYNFAFTDNGYTLNGTPCSDESFEAFYNKLSGIVSNTHSSEAAQTAAGEDSFTITYHFKDTSYSDVTAVYTPYDSNYYTASCGQMSGRLVNKRSVESVLSLLEAVK